MMKQNRILKLPKHGNPNGNRIASTPYNFIPLPETVVLAVENANDLPDHDQYHAERHTGYFEVILTTKAPLYVRCPFTVERFMEQEQGKDASRPFREQVRNTPDFFYTTDPKHPVIPGSSLRGMLRGVLEIASYSKMHFVSDRRLVYRAVGDVSSLGYMYRRFFLGENKTRKPNMRFDYPLKRVKGGYLKKHGAGWAIQPAKTIKGETFVHVEYKDANRVIGGHGRQKVHDVFVEPVGRHNSNRGRRGKGYLILDVAITPRVSPNSASGLEPAKLVESGHIDGKHWHCAIYEPDEQKKPVEIPEELWQLYEEDRDLTRGIPTRPLLREGDPLFYLVDDRDKLVFFGPTKMFRLLYLYSTVDFIPGGLRSFSDIDYAEAIFGYTKGDQIKAPQGDKARAYAGRVFVTDATLLSPSDDIWLSEKPIVPKILSSPKPTAFQHYLVQPDSKDPRDLKHYGSKPVEETVIRGHKRYWLQENPSIQQIEDSDAPDNSTQHTQFKPLKAGVQFKFRIYFENLSDEELGALCWTLHPFAPENDSIEYCHQLGMGKPFGMGAVKLEATLYLTDRKKRYSALCNGNAWETGVGEPKRLSERTVLQELVRSFEQHVLQCLRLETHCKHLYQVKRIATLLKMMEFPGYPSEKNGDCYLSSQKRPNTRYMCIEPNNEYRYRPVLPDPSAFGRLLGECEPKPD